MATTTVRAQVERSLALIGTMPEYRDRRMANVTERKALRAALVAGARTSARVAR